MINQTVNQKDYQPLWDWTAMLKVVPIFPLSIYRDRHSRLMPNVSLTLLPLHHRLTNVLTFFASCLFLIGESGLRRMLYCLQQIPAYSGLYKMHCHLFYILHIYKCILWRILLRLIGISFHGKWNNPRNFQRAAIGLESQELKDGLKQN